MQKSADHVRAEIRAGLEQARGAFTDLVGSLSKADLRIKADSGWSVGEVATHVVSSIEHAPGLIHALRRDRDYLNFPLPVTERVKRLITWWTARGATPQRLVRRFDVAYPPVLALLDTIRSDEWERSGRAYGEGSWTVGNALRHQGEHVQEHIQQIRRLLRPG
jgi:hypothetical protein